MKTNNFLDLKFADYFKNIPHKNNKITLILFILAACWLTNYLLIQGFGLYHDDWPAMADFTKLKLWGVSGPIDWF
jgi:hypothetical protein